VSQINIRLNSKETTAYNGHLDYIISILELLRIIMEEFFSWLDSILEYFKSH